MAVDAVSFWLKPSGFFDQNPSIDAAPSMKMDGDHCHTGAGEFEHGEHGDHSHER